MRDRREHQRFELAAQHAGVLRYLSSVEVVRAERDEFVVIADQAATPGEVFVFRGVDPAGSPVSVRVGSCRPVLMDGRVRFEVRLNAERPAVGVGA